MARGNFGERLHRERELREVSLSEITKATCIGTRFLEALENEDWGKLPGGVFNRGFVRAIARYLGLDEEALLAEYDMAHGPQPQQPAANSFPIQQTGPPRWVLPVVALLALLALLAAGYYGWQWYAARRGVHRATVQEQIPTTGARGAAATAPTPTPVSLPASTGPGTAGASTEGDSPLLLSVSLSAATRVRVVADGNLVLDAELRPGDSHHFTAQNGYRVTAGDSSAVLLELNGQAMPPIGAPGASGTIALSRKDLRPAPSGTDQPGTN